MPKSTKLLIGLFTALPLITCGYLAVRFLTVFFAIFENGGNVNPERIWDTFYELFGIQLATLGIVILLLGVYLWHLLVVHARQHIRANVPVWVIAFLLVPIVAMPVYWFVNIWPEGNNRDDRAQSAGYQA